MRTNRGTPLAVAVIALLVGLAVGRFLAFDAPGAAAPLGAGEDAVRRLERAVAENPDDVPSWQALGTAATQRAAETGDPSFYGLAERALTRAADLAPGAPETLLARGHLALALHDFAEARALATQALRQRPRSADVRGVLVDAAVELGDYEAAAEHLQAMLDQRPALPALARASYLRELHGDLPGAVEAMQRAETAGSGSAFELATVRVLLGDLHRMAGDVDAAAGAYDRALAVRPALVAAEVGLARVEVARGDTGAAIERLEAVVDRFPQPDAVILLGDLHARAGAPERAGEQYALARALTRLQAEAGQNIDLELALFEADRGEDPQRAVALATRAYEERPDNVFAADALAWAHFRNGRPEAAVPLITDALRLGTADPLLRYHAAEIFAATGETERARAELATAAGSQPWFPPAHADRARALATELGVAWPAGDA